ncbi:MAG: uridine kinase [Alphaproteobacteria bacterium]|nr:uridine kinase [Alphaproteobacteria bacterium]
MTVIGEGATFLRCMADRIADLPYDRTMLVAIDGVDGAGKTMLADALAGFVTARGRPVIRASIDGFHNPRDHRYRRGRDSPEGYFLDSYDYAGLKAALLDPLRPGGSGRYRTALFDHVVDRPVVSPEHQVAPRSVLILDGVFLHRPELRACWDFSLFLDVGFEVSQARKVARDPSYAGSPQAMSRYIPGQQLYLTSCEPARRATVVVDYNDLSAPRLG